MDSSSPKCEGSPKFEDNVEVFTLEVEQVLDDSPEQEEMGLDEQGVEEEEVDDIRREKSGTPIFRKVLNVAEEEENVCSICLDEFTEADPSSTTACG